MQSIASRRTYAAVPAHVTGESDIGRRPPRSRKENNYKPIPLRWPFLLVICLLFATSIALIEVLMHDSHTVSTTAAKRSVNAVITSAHQHPIRPQKTSSRIRPVTRIHRRGTDRCENYDSFPAWLTSLSSVSSSLCSDFTVTFQPYTHNLSEPLMTAAEQWLLHFNEVTSSKKEALLSSDGCEIDRGIQTISNNPARGSYTESVSIGCSMTSVVFENDGCTAYATITIENHAFTSRLAEAVCDQSQAPLSITSETTPTPTEGSNAKSIPPTATATPAATIPTITLPAQTAQDQPEPTADAVPVPVVQTVVTNLNDVNSVAQVVTDAAGNVNTVVAVAQSATYTHVDADGVTQTVVSDLGRVTGTVSPVVTTNAAGVVETVTAVVVGVQNTQVTTNAQGQVQTLVTTTYVTTDAQGQVQTIITALPLANNQLTTYVSTNSNGEIYTIVDRLEATTRWTTTTQYTSLVATTGADGKVTSFSAVVVETVTLTTSPNAASQTASGALSTTAGAPHPTLGLLSSQKVVNGKFTHIKYAAAMYLPALLAILIKVLWEMVLAAVKLVQPFERMVREQGGKAQYTFFAQYLSSSLSLDMLKSLGYGNFIPLWATIMYYLVQIGAPLATASMTVRAQSTCFINNRDTPCNPAWIIDIWFLRTVEAVLGLCLLLTALVAWSTHRSQTGLESDPSSLASLAKLLNYDALLEYIQQNDTGADRHVFESAFEQHRFRLGLHRSSTGEILYGIIGFRGKNMNSSDEDLVATSYDQTRLRGAHDYHSIHDDRSMMSGHSQSFAQTAFLTRTRRALIWDVLGLLMPLSLFAIVVAFILDHNYDDALNKFLNSNSVAPRLVLICIASGSAMHLSHIERCVRVTEPFRRLVRDHQSTTSTKSAPETSLLVTRCGTSYSNLPYLISLLRYEHRGGKMAFQILITVTTILADLNILAASGVAYSGASTADLYRFSEYTTIGVSGWIVAVYIIIIFWWRRLPVIRLLTGEGISKGAGTIGGTARWLCSGGPDVLEAVTQSAGEWNEKRMGRHTYGRHQRDEGENLYGSRVWFAHNRSRTDTRGGRWYLEAQIRGGSSDVGSIRERPRLPPELANYL